jgi:hypothetical protein
MGFTLIELLLSATILAVIVGSITTALIVFLQNGGETLRRDDHSGGAGVLASYVDRDVASADTAVLTGTTCSGGQNLLLLSWTEFTASSAAPMPTPSGDPFFAAYQILPDPSSVTSAGVVRDKLQRVSCRGTTVLDRTDVVLNLTPAGATATLAPSVACPNGSALTFTLKPYESDVSPPYTFTSCTRTRLG